LGEIEVALQLKLLRVLQTREFQRIGENITRKFGGKIDAVTNVNLADEIHAGRFRADLYYRLCSDVITMPSLYEQLCQQPGELAHLALLMARRLVDDQYADLLAEEAIAWFEKKLGRHYPWPGNMREFEQAMRNILVRKEYYPASDSLEKALPQMGPVREFSEQILRGHLSAEQVLSRYCTLVYWQEGSYEAAARRLQLDRRTLKSRIDEEFFAALRLLPECSPHAV
jgi:transcriptional regulator with PAS, ATPase and Fis domain